MTGKHHCERLARGPQIPGVLESQIAKAPARGVKGVGFAEVVFRAYRLTGLECIIAVDEMKCFAGYILTTVAGAMIQGL